MNVTASKILLGVSLAGLAYGSWDYLSVSELAAPPAPRGRELTAAMVNRSAVLELQRDPFHSTPLARFAASAPLADQPGKELAELKLQGVLISPTGRVALINGRMLREGDVMDSAPGKARVRATRVGVDYAVVEGAGRMHMLHVEEPVLAPQPRGGIATLERD